MKGCRTAYIACNLMSKSGTVRYEVGQEINDSHPFFTQEGEDREDNPSLS
jgi:arabinoxylan arabinofuranohydrolase